MQISEIHEMQKANNAARLRDLEKYAHTIEFQRRVDQSLDLLATFLQHCNNPVISCGGGKDGTAVALLSRLLGADTPIICANPPNPLPDREEHKENLKHWLNREWIDVPYNWDVDLVISGAEKYPEGLKMRTLSKFQKDHGIDGVVFGIRAAESRKREINLAMRGEIYETPNGARCQPIVRWRAEDSLCLALLMDAPINPVYIKMDGAGSLEQLHDGTWWPHGMENRSGWMRRYYPDYYDLYEAALKIYRGKSDECRY